MPHDVVVVGSLHLDIMVAAPGRPRQGETLVGTAWSEKCGGKGGNQAVAASRHGARTTMIGAVGNDAFGRKLLDNLRARGVDIRHVSIFDRAGSGMSVAITDPDGDYAAVIVSGVNLSLDAAAIAATGRTIATAGCVVLQNEVPDAVNIAAAVAGCRRVVLNAAPARPLPSELSARLSVLVVNAVEAEMMGAGPVADLVDAAAAAQRLLGRSAAVAVTAGGAGMAVADRDGPHFVLPSHKVAVVSTHGAGDAFVGALAARLAAGDTLANAARYANAAAAILVATPETQRGALSPDAVWRLLS